MAQAAATPKKAAPKKPSDRKAKDEPEVVMRAEEVEGWDLLVPFSEVPIWDQMPLIKLLQQATDDSEELSDEEFANLSVEEREEYKANQEHRSFDIEILGQLALKLRDFAVDEAAYTKFCSGTNAMQRSLNLAMAWVGQMGESESSENS